MQPQRPSLAVLLALGLIAALPAQRGKKPRIKPWDDFAKGGWQLATKTDSFFTTLDKKELPKIVARIEELRASYQKHFGAKLKKGWRFVVLTDMKQYNKYVTEVSKARQNVQGQCLRQKKLLTVCNSKSYGWLTTLSHEYAHAYYDCNGPIWLREGIASLVECAEITGKGRKRKMTIPINHPRLRGLRIHQRRKHYSSIQHLLRGEKEPDGYGYSYEHGWSVHYFLYNRDPKKYVKFLAAVRKKTGRNLATDVEKAFGMKLPKMDKEWAAFTKKLKAKAR